MGRGDSISATVFCEIFENFLFVRIERMPLAPLRLWSRAFFCAFFLSLGGCGAKNVTEENPPLRIAVASNAAKVMRNLVQEFQAQTGHKVSISAASSGSLFAMIQNGAPFDIFFSADVLRPKALESQSQAVGGSRFTYAIGQLALWSPHVAPRASREKLDNVAFQHLAIGNPKLAPYGKAAWEFLETLDAWDSIEPKLLRGENIGQAFQFVAAGEAEWGLVALSQIQSLPDSKSGTHWIVPSSLYPPILQQAILLKEGLVAQEFVDYVRGDSARRIFQSYGYLTP
mgnify:CR=1 FL=1